MSRRNGKLWSVVSYLAAASALVMLVLSLLFWRRSHTIGDELTWYQQPTNLEIRSNAGLLMVTWGKLRSMEYPPRSGFHGSFWPFQRDVDTMTADLKGAARHRLFGFAFDHWVRESAGISVNSYVTVWPYWFISMFLAVVSTVGIGSILRRARLSHRLATGLCPACGYDLRASKERCPECGHAIMVRSRGK